MLSDILKKHSNELLRPLGVFMGRIGIRPNNLTFLGLALTMAAACTGPRARAAVLCATRGE